MKNILQKIRKTSERGQAIILVAFSIVGLVAIVGLMIDGGILLIEYARLKRGIDAASIAASSQFRKNFSGEDLVKAGEEFLRFNESDAAVTIFTCSCPPNEPTCLADGWHLDTALCSAPGLPKRKLVRITASQHVDFGFIRIVGINGTTISASSVGEAASIDMVLVIDTSTSMAYETYSKADGTPFTDGGDPGNLISGNPGDNPEDCNSHMSPTPNTSNLALPRRCEPLGKVKDAAADFVDQLFFPYDRVALVASTGQETSGATRDPVTVPIGGVAGFSSNGTDGSTTDIQGAIRGLRVFQPDRCPTDLGGNLNNTAPCLLFNDSNVFQTQACIPKDIGVLDPTDTSPPYNTLLMNGGNVVKDPTTCGSSNIGGGLYEAGGHFADARQDSFWVTIALFGGPANAFNPLGDPDRQCPGTPMVPSPNWLPNGQGWCRDEDDMSSIGWTIPAAPWTPTIAASAAAFDWSTYDFGPRDPSHRFTVNTATDPDTIIYPTAYDADDYARDGADYITSPPDGTTSKGQGATLFAICMGSSCKATPNRKDPASAELLGRYMALHAGDQYDILGNVTKSANHGLYFYAENSAALLGPNGVFAKISENIFTRISQ